MISSYEQKYASLVKDIMRRGLKKPSRAGDTLSTFGMHLTIENMRYGEFPILLGRKMYYQGVFGELAAMLRGPQHVSDFTRQGCNYWADWADADGALRLDYGNAWIDFNGVNQLENVVNSINNDPNGRRHIISGWRPDRLNDLSLPCCHLLYQWYVNGDYLDMMIYLRSLDVMIGLPSDVILAAVWNIAMAAETNYIPGTLHIMAGDTHIYDNHLSDATQYLHAVYARKSINLGEAMPSWDIVKGVKLKTFDPTSIEINNYYPSEPIKFELNV